MRTQKSFVFMLLLVLGSAVSALTGCGGSTPAPAPPSGNFSNASLKGQYAFSLTGVEIQNGAYTARIGSFTTDGAGNITGGLEDQLNLSAGQTASEISFTGGTYQIADTGRGTISLQAASGVLQLSVVLQSSSTGSLVETDLGAATSGSVHLQTASDFSAAALTSQYVFELFGVTFVPSASAPLSLIGEFNANGSGSITGGVMDINNGNLTPSGATVIPATSYAMDGANGTSFGRGTMTLNGYTLAFYIVDSTHIIVLEEDSLGGSAGDAYLQSAPPTQNSQFTGNFIYQINGLFTKGTQGPISRVARFTASASGSLTAVTVDSSYNGNYTHAAQASSATYAIDTGNSGSGRGIFSFTEASFAASYVFYVVSSSQMLVQETSPGVIAGGPMFPQAAGPFSLSGLTGNFVFAWNGVQLGANTAIPIQESFVGQYTLSNTATNNISGATDYTEMGLTGNSLFTGVTLGGTLSITGDGTANNLYKFAVNGSPSVTVNFQAYFASPSIVLLVTSDNNRTFIGTLVQQAQ